MLLVNISSFVLLRVWSDYQKKIHQTELILLITLNTLKDVKELTPIVVPTPMVVPIPVIVPIPMLVPAPLAPLAPAPALLISMKPRYRLQ